MTPAPLTKEDTIPTDSEDLIEEIEVVLEHIEFEFGDNVVYPHHGAGQVLKKESTRDVRPGARLPGRSRSCTTT